MTMSPVTPLSHPIQVAYRRGIHLPEADLWLDPHFGAPRAFVSHAHADHVARHRVTLCSPLTARLMRRRFGAAADAVFQELPWRQPVAVDGWILETLPAGHIAGSSMLHLTRESDGASLLYTGDFKLRQSLSSSVCEPRRAGTLIMETTFGLPRYRFPPTEEVMADARRWVMETLEDGKIPVLLGYSLGKAQEILCLLKPLGIPVMVHESVWKMTEELRPELGELLPEILPFDPANARGSVLVFPPNAARSVALRRLKICRTAMLTGWAVNSGAKFRHQVDEVFPLSDHADYPDLLEMVTRVAPGRVWLVHGSVREFAADLRRRGYDARALGHDDQLELDLPPDTEASETPAAPARADAASQPEQAANSFARWASACEAAAAHSSRLKKIAILTSHWPDLGDDDLLLTARFLSGDLRASPHGSAGDSAPLQVGGALIRRALMEVTGLSETQYRAVSRSQNDLGRTAQILLSERPPPGDPARWTLPDVGRFVERLRGASGALARLGLLAGALRELDAWQGAWLIRLLAGDLRIGASEGMLDEALAAAFQQPLEAVREASMMTGDAGQTALLARMDSLHLAAPRPLIPLKAMLAAPVETAGAIWQRVTGGSNTAPEADTREDEPVAAWLEDKFDGVRAQAHRIGERAEIFSRDLKPLTGAFPEVIAALLRLPGDMILDGEIIARAEDKKLSFFDLQKRISRHEQSDLFLPSDITVRYMVFDLLWNGGQSMLKTPLAERRAVLETLALPAPLELAPVARAGSAEEIEAAFMAARRRGNEGLIIKSAGSPYTPGRRGRAWLKYKKAFATLDVVVVRVEQGHGKRSHMISDYTFAVRDDSDGARRFLTIGKAYSGLTDAEIEELTQVFLDSTIEVKGRARIVEPAVVLEIAFDSIQPSARHESGLALRFPRIKGMRRDKTPADIDTLAHARRLAGVES
jgi:DNA ligase-1